MNDLKADRLVQVGACLHRAEGECVEAWLLSFLGQAGDRPVAPAAQDMFPQALCLKHLQGPCFPKSAPE